MADAAFFCCFSSFEIKGTDLIITDQDDPQRAGQDVRVKNFMMGAQYQHLSVVFDEQMFNEQKEEEKQKNEHKLALKVDNQGVYIGQRVLSTSGDDCIEVYHDSQIIGNIIDAGDGDDVLSYFGKKNISISGGQGHDEITVIDANHVIAGNEGNDILRGGSGNDTYLFKKGDGVDILLDRGGEDSLKIENIESSQIWLKRNQSHLQIMVGKQDATDSILITDYFKEKDYEIETISLNDQDYSLRHYQQAMAVLGNDFHICLDQLDGLHKDLQKNLFILQKEKKKTWPDLQIELQGGLGYQTQEIDAIRLDPNKTDVLIDLNTGSGKQANVKIRDIYGPTGEINNTSAMITLDGFVIEFPTQLSEDSGIGHSLMARYEARFDRTLEERTQNLLRNYMEVRLDPDLKTVTIGNITSILPENVSFDPSLTEQKIREQFWDNNPVAISDLGRSGKLEGTSNADYFFISPQQVSDKNVVITNLGGQPRPDSEFFPIKQDTVILNHHPKKMVFRYQQNGDLLIIHRSNNHQSLQIKIENFSQSETDAHPLCLRQSGHQDSIFNIPSLREASSVFDLHHESMTSDGQWFKEFYLSESLTVGKWLSPVG